MSDFETMRPQFNPELDHQQVIGAKLRILRPSELVHYWVTFRSTVELPFPSAITRDTVDDVAAVLAGSKPATLYEPRDSGRVRLLRQAIGDIADHLVSGRAVDGFGTTHEFFGEPASVITLTERYNSVPNKPNPVDDSFHRAVGRALGYPEEVIEAFITK